MERGIIFSINISPLVRAFFSVFYALYFCSIFSISFVTYLNFDTISAPYRCAHDYP